MAEKNYSDMAVSELRSEIKVAFEQADLIEKKYPKGEITNQEDMTQVKKLLTDIDAMESHLAVKEDAESRKARILQGIERYNKPAAGALRPGATAENYENAMRVTPGDQFIKSREYMELKQSGVLAGGMLPKIDACRLALESDVRSVHIIDGRVPHCLILELFTSAGIGTMITRH